MGAVTLISNGIMMLLKYKLNNMCDPKRVRKPQWAVHKQLNSFYIPQYIVVVNMKVSE